MPTYYVEDYDGERDSDATPAAPAEETKVITAPDQSEPKTSNADVTTKG